MRIHDPTFGASFLEHYLRLGGARTTFTPSQSETLRRADRAQTLALLRDLRAFGGSDADVLLLPDIESPEGIAKLLAGRKQQAFGPSLLAALLLVILGVLLALLN